MCPVLQNKVGVSHKKQANHQIYMSKKEEAHSHMWADYGSG